VSQSDFDKVVLEYNETRAKLKLVGLVPENQTTPAERRDIAAMPAAEPTPVTAIVTFKDRATPIADMGIPVIPLLPRKKYPDFKDWQFKATVDPVQIDKWNSERPDSNVGCVAYPGGYWFFEVDSKDVEPRIEDETGQKIPRTYRVRSRTGRGHFYFKSSAASDAMGNIAQGFVKYKDFSVRVDREFVVGPGSIHPDSGLPYTTVCDAAIVPAPDWLVEWIKGQREEAKKDTLVDGNKPIEDGSRNVTLAAMAGKMRYAGFGYDAIEPAALSHNETNCVPPLSEDEVKGIVASICRYEAGNPDLYALTIGGKIPGSNPVPTKAMEATDAIKRLEAWLKDEEGSAMESEAVIELCASLSDVQYENRRSKIAKKLGGWRTTVLDDARKKVKPKETGVLDGTEVTITDTTSWETPVVLADVLDEIESTLNRFIHFRRKEDATTVALWIAQTWTVDFQGNFPYLGARSPIPACGKTTLLTLISLMSQRPFIASSVTTACIFRLTHIYHPTLIIDEMDTMLERDPEFFGILQSGHSREAGKALRVLGDDLELRSFNTYGAKAYGMIGDAKDAFASRTLPVILDPKCPEDNLEDYPWDGSDENKKLRAYLNTISQKLLRWVKDNETVIRNQNPDCSGLINRVKDNWRPLLVIAELASQGWTLKARQAAGLGNPYEQEHENKLFLQDVRDIFYTLQVESLSNADLIRNLEDQSHNGWKEYGRLEKGINKKIIGRIFNSFGIQPRPTWDPETKKTVRSYHLADMANALKRVLSGVPPRNVSVQVTGQTACKDLGFSADGTASSFVPSDDVIGPAE
jgi:hypothetical protein